jgi:Tol biopolymer transport system component
VYRGRDTRLDRTVAIKVLNSALTANADLKARFEREAKAISALQHPHICTLYDVGHQEGTDFLVMEYLEGETLAQRLRRGPLPLAQLLKTANEIADALDRAHRAGIVHRDLKPGNVMLTKAGAKLLDFGLAKPFGAAGATPASNPTVPLLSAAITLSNVSPQLSPLTMQGSIVGTIQYMSPEQIEGKEADARSDIFAFAALLYEMATGKRAFEGKSQLSVASAILEKEPEPMSGLQPGMPVALEHVIHACLAKDPEERYQSARDVKLELDWVAAAPAAAAPATATAKPGSARVAWTVAGTALLIALLFAVAPLFRSAPRPAVLRAALLPPKGVTILPTHLAVSADGRRLVFAGMAENKIMLWLRALDATAAQAIPGTDGAQYPFWSPDGRFIGFFAGGKLKKVDPATGAVGTIADAPAPRGGAWSDQDTIVFAPEATGPLFQTSSSGGSPAPLTQLDSSTGEVSHRWPQFLHGGRYLLFWQANSRDSGAISVDPGDKQSGAYLLDLKTRQKRLLLQTDSGALYAGGHLLYIWQDNLMAQPLDPAAGKLTGTAETVAQQVSYDNDRWIGSFTAAESGALLYVRGVTFGAAQLEWVDRAGKDARRFGDTGGFLWPTLSPDAQRIAVSISSGRTVDICVLEFARGTKTRITFDEVSHGYPAWSPDGRRIAYTTGLVGQGQAVYVKNASGIGDPEKLLDAPPDSSLVGLDWSRDGRALIYGLFTRAKGGRLWMYRFADKKSEKLLPGDLREGSAKMSPDGKWLAYRSLESGQGEVYVVPLPKVDGKWQISTAGGDYPRWRADGKEIFYLSPNGTMMSVAINTEGGFKPGLPQPLFATVLKAFPGFQYDVAPDGKHFLLNNWLSEASAEPIVVVTNWTAELKK